MVQRNQQCLQCDFKTTKKASLQTHTKSLHEGQKFQCSLCGSAFTQPSNLQKHIKSVHGGHEGEIIVYRT